MRRARAGLRRLGEAFDDSIRLGFLQELSPAWQASFPELCLGLGISMAFVAAFWLAIAWPPLAAQLGLAAFNGLLFLAVWFILMPVFVVLVIYAVKLVYWARHRN